jgi:nicotinamidase-related amidase
MDVAAGDLVLDKYRYGAFSCPARALPQALQQRGVGMVVVAGTLTNVCCESTAREANMAGFKMIVVSDATAAASDAEHNGALLNLRLAFADVRTTRELLRMIAALRG